MPDTSVHPDLKGFQFDDYRADIWGDSYNWDFVRKLTDIVKLAIHHSVTQPPHDMTPRQQADQLAEFHKNRGWGGIGYHLVVAKDGTVLYVGDVGTGRANITGNNEKIIGICLIGDFTKELPTQEQIVATHYLVEYFLTQRPDMPNVNTWDDVIGHKDAVKLWPTATATECPGDQWGSPDNLHDRIRDLHFDGYPRWISTSPVPVKPAPTPTPEPPKPSVPPVEAPKPPVETPTPSVPTVEPSVPPVVVPPVATPDANVEVPKPNEIPQVCTDPNHDVLATKLKAVELILFGKGFWWTKIWQLRALFQK